MYLQSTPYDFHENWNTLQGTTGSNAGGCALIMLSHMMECVYMCKGCVFGCYVYMCVYFSVSYTVCVMTFNWLNVINFHHVIIMTLSSSFHYGRIFFSNFSLEMASLFFFSLEERVNLIELQLGIEFIKSTVKLLFKITGPNWHMTE